MLQSQNVLRLLHDANLASVSVVAAADEAGVRVGNIKTDGAQPGLLLYRKYSISQKSGLLFRGSEQIVGKALGALWSDAGQFIQFLNELRYYSNSGYEFLVQPHPLYPPLL